MRLFFPCLATVCFVFLTLSSQNIFAATPIFQSASDFVTGETPGQIATGDFNRDGKSDMAVANQGSGTTDLGSITILLGKGNGTFQASTNLTNGLTNPASVAVGDFNADGKLDLVVVNFGVTANQISVLLGNGDGTFQNPTAISPGGITNLVAVADLDQDGHADLICTISGEMLDAVSVLRGNGDGTFQKPVLYEFGFASQPAVADGISDIISVGDGAIFIVVADFNGDGKPDVAEANLSGHIAMFLNSGNGTLNAPVDYATGANPQAIAAADFNGDGHLDLAAACNGVSAGNGDVSVLLNQGNGTFTAGQTITNMQGPGGIFAADFTGDGKVECHPRLNLFVGAFGKIHESQLDVRGVSGFHCGWSVDEHHSEVSLRKAIAITSRNAL